MRIVVAVVVLGLLTLSCTRAIRVPVSHYDSIDLDKGQTYVLETVDHKSYRLKRFTFTDSTLVVMELENFDANHAEPASPIVIPRDEILTLDRLAVAEGKTLLLLFGLGVVAAAIIVVATISIPFD